VELYLIASLEKNTGLFSIGQPEDDGVAELFEQAGFRCAFVFLDGLVILVRGKQTLNSWNMPEILYKHHVQAFQVPHLKVKVYNLFFRNIPKYCGWKKSCTS